MTVKIYNDFKACNFCLADIFDGGFTVTENKSCGGDQVKFAQFFPTHTGAAVVEPEFSSKKCPKTKA